MSQMKHKQNGKKASQKNEQIVQQLLCSMVLNQDCLAHDASCVEMQLTTSAALRAVQFLSFGSAIFKFRFFSF